MKCQLSGVVCNIADNGFGLGEGKGLEPLNFKLRTND